MCKAEKISERSLDTRMRLAIPVRAYYEGSHRVGYVVRGQPDVSDHTRSVNVCELERGACRYLTSGRTLATDAQRTARKTAGAFRASGILEGDRAATHAPLQFVELAHVIHQ